MSPTFAQSVPSSGPTTVGSAVGVAGSGLVVETPGGDVLVPIAASSAAANENTRHQNDPADVVAPHAIYDVTPQKISQGCSPIGHMATTS